MGRRIFISKVHQTQSLLRTLESQNVEAYHECCQGHCGTCKAKLVSGTVSYPSAPLSEVDDDECLICCAYPVTDVVLEIDG